MSVKATTWAWEQETRNAGQLLVLLAIADHASEHDDPDLPDGLIAWPKIATLAGMTGFTYDTVRKNIASLVEDGLVEKVNRRVHGIRAGAWVLRLAVEARSESGTGNPVKSGSMDPVKSGLGGPVISPNIEPEESNPKDEPRTLALLGDTNVVAAADPDAAFNDFWEMYGRIGPKKKARECWDRAIKKDDPSVIIDGLERWVEYWRTPGAASVKWPQGWLNEERWRDDPPMGLTRVNGPSTATTRSRDVLERLAAGDLS